MKISILIMNAYGMGGTVRATFNLADELALRHDVEVVSVFRHRNRPFLPHSDKVRLTHLVDLRPAAKKWWRFGFASRLEKPSTLFHPEERAYSNFNAESDRKWCSVVSTLNEAYSGGTQPGTPAGVKLRDGFAELGRDLGC